MLSRPGAVPGLISVSYRVEPKLQMVSEMDIHLLHVRSKNM